MTDQDKKLCKRLNALSVENPEFWSFREDDAREHVHGYFQYPAMMVPQVQSALIHEVRQVDASVKSIFDPFMGSGTILGETMRFGMDFGGCDINPLALLICLAKTAPFDVCGSTESAERLLRHIQEDKDDTVEIKFSNLEKWFRSDVAVGLSRIRRAIQREQCLHFRRFLWVMLAETVRLTSNSRTDTVKLYARPVAETKARCIKPIDVFTATLRRNLQNMEVQRQALVSAQLLRRHEYKKALNLRHSDARKISLDLTDHRLYDLAVTSPPYGDNCTTVTYGQHSYLPLQWIPFEDIDANLEMNTWLLSTHEIDARSLGGSRAEGRNRSVAVLARDLQEKSPTLATLYNDLSSGNEKEREGARRVIRFCHDLDACIDPLLSILVPGAYLILTVGNRSVRHRTLKLDNILAEFLAYRDVEDVHRIQRTITGKRQASRNKLSVTMSKESIMILRKDGA